MGLPKIEAMRTRETVKSRGGSRWSDYALLPLAGMMEEFMKRDNHGDLDECQTFLVGGNPTQPA